MPHNTLFSAFAECMTSLRDGVSDTPIFFVSGAQGIGKSTAVAKYQTIDPNTVVLSLDDFYLTKSDREKLAARVSPLFEVRGPPGTHDLSLFEDVLGGLKDGRRVRLPQFDKLRDERAPMSEWILSPPEVSTIVIEGWMMGALARPASAKDQALNDIERMDSDGGWRAHQEAQLATAYAPIWQIAHHFIHFTAPSFSTVFRWRLQQEATTRKVQVSELTSQQTRQVANFIEYFERITRRMIAGMRSDGYSIVVDQNRNVISL